jgi:hypothetical protein
MRYEMRIDCKTVELFIMQISVFGVSQGKRIGGIDWKHINWVQYFIQNRRVFYICFEIDILETSEEILGYTLNYKKLLMYKSENVWT